MQLKESGEMYLETIYVLSKKSNYIRSIDVCEEMGYSKPSVSRAVGLLKEGGAIRLCTPPRSDASNIFLNEVLIQSAFLVHKISIKSMKTFTVISTSM